ncbi:flagellar hook-length control protein FliK [Devosia elaeis]|nr:flagellar hook-length control protein FliK [Devosia elaeis]
MSISSQLPPIPLAQASAMLRAMAHAGDQNVEARVLAQLANGTTQVQIGRQVMNLQLPAPQPIGTTLTLAVQQGEGQVRMALLSVQPPRAAGSAPVETPATSVQLSAAALSGQRGPNAAPPVNPQPATNTAMAAPSSGAAAVPGERTPASAASPAVAATATGRPAIPYAVAAPVVAPGPAVANMGSATTALPPVAQSAGAAPVGQHQAAPNGPAPQVATPVARSPAPAMAAPAPQAALGQMVQQALARQDSVVGLTTALTQAVGRLALPAEVAKAAQQVLGQSLALDNGGPSAAGLQKAIRNSGIFQEAMLAAGQGRAAGGDMKTALLGLQRQLGAWLGEQPALDPVRAIPPPLRGAMPRARGGDAPPADLPDDPNLAGKVLFDRTEAALSRLRLHQHASLPEPAARHEAQWSMDLPVVMGGQQSLLHLHIHRDRDADPERPEDRGWQVRFAINLSDMGEIGAQISLRGSGTGVLLWAERAEIAALLDAGIDALRQEIEGLGLVPGALVVRAGAPSAPAHPATTAGHIVDAMG